LILNALERSSGAGDALFRSVVSNPSEKK